MSDKGQRTWLAILLTVFLSTSTPVVILGWSYNLLISLTSAPVTSSHSRNLLPWLHLEWISPSSVSLSEILNFSNWWQFTSFQLFTSSFLLIFLSPLFLFYLFSFFTAPFSWLFLFPLNHQPLSDFLPSLSSLSLIWDTRWSVLHSPFKSIVPLSCSLTILQVSALN